MLEKWIMVVVVSPLPHWELYMDGATNQKGSRLGIVITSPKHVTIKNSLKLSISAINNKAKYEALLTGLNAIKNLRERQLKCSMN